MKHPVALKHISSGRGSLTISRNTPTTILCRDGAVFAEQTWSKLKAIKALKTAPLKSSTKANKRLGTAGKAAQ